MAGSARGPAVLLASAGVVLLLLGIAGMMAGLLFADRLYRLLPPITIDAAAVGGATVALGASVGLLGVGHLVLALALWRAAGRAWVPAIVLSATMSAVAFGWSVAAVVSAASGSGLLAIMLPGGIGLALVAVAYGWIAGVVIGLRRSAQRS